MHNFVHDMLHVSSAAQLIEALLEVCLIPSMYEHARSQVRQWYVGVMDVYPPVSAP